MVRKILVILDGTQPERALEIIDLALVVGSVSPFRALFVRAMVYANSLERPQLNKAIELCESPTSFREHFKKEFGMPPKEYRQNL